MTTFGCGHGDISESLEKRMSEFAVRYGARFIVQRRVLCRFHFEVDGDMERTADGATALFDALREDPPLYAELKRETDLFSEEDIEF